MSSRHRSDPDLTQTSSLQTSLLEKAPQQDPERPPDWAIWAKPALSGIELIHAHFDQDITVAQLSADAGISRVHLTRAFKSAQGTAPRAYLNSMHIHEAKARIHAGMPLAAVACDVGYADQSHFYRRFKGATGATPAQWKAGRE